VPQVITKELIIYPNPATEEVNIEVKTETNYHLLNITGNIEQQGTLKASNNSISVQSLPYGIYLLVLTDNEGQKTIRKIVKQ